MLVRCRLVLSPWLLSFFSRNWIVWRICVAMCLSIKRYWIVCDCRPITLRITSMLTMVKLWCSGRYLCRVGYWAAIYSGYRRSARTSISAMARIVKTMWVVQSTACTSIIWPYERRRNPLSGRIWCVLYWRGNGISHVQSMLCRVFSSVIVPVLILSLTLVSAGHIM